MAGIEILAAQEVAIGSAFNWVACWITFGICVGVFLCIGAGLSLYESDWTNLFMSIVAGVMVGVIFGSSIGTELRTPTEYRTQYKVTISDKVLMNELLEKYEIIDQEGKIYTVRERNQEDLQ